MQTLKQELEIKLLNLILLNNECINLIETKYFTFKLKKILEILKEIYENNNEIKPMDVYYQLRKFDLPLLDDLEFVTMDNFQYIYNKIKEIYYANKMDNYLKSRVLPFLNNKFDYKKALTNLQTLQNNQELHSNINITSVNETIDNVLTFIEQYSNSSGLSTKLPTLDYMLKGIRKNQYFIIAGRPHMGKTTLALTLAYNFIKQNSKVLFFSFEQSKEILLSQLIGLHSNKDFFEITKEDIEQFNEKYNNIIYFYDKPLNIFDLKIMVKSSIIRHNINIVFIDYIGLLKTHNPKIKRHEIISEISKEIKRLTMEDNITVFALAQINRGNELNKNKKPTLATLKESGALEEDADKILLLYREKYYNSNVEDIMEVILAKNRGVGKTGIVSTKMYNHNLVEVDTNYEDEELPF